MREVAKIIIDSSVVNDPTKTAVYGVIITTDDKSDLLEESCLAAYPPNTPRGNILDDILISEGPNIVYMDGYVLQACFIYLAVEGGMEATKAADKLVLTPWCWFTTGYVALEKAPEHYYLVHRDNHFVLAWLQHSTQLPLVCNDHLWCRSDFAIGNEYLLPNMIYYLIQEVLHKRGLSILSLCHLPASTLHVVLRILIWSDCQNGKSMETVALSWLLYMLSGCMTIILVNKSSAYLSFMRDVADFNNWILEALSGLSDRYGVDPDAYQIHYYYHLRARPIDPLHLRKRYCILYARVLRADNIERIMETDLNLFVPFFGVSSTGLLNINLVVDEIQNAYKTKELSVQKVERAFFQYNYATNIANATEEYIRNMAERRQRIDIDSGIVHQLRSRYINFIAAFRHVVEVSATHLPCFIASEKVPASVSYRDFTIQIPPREDYFGIGEHLAEDRRIETVVYTEDCDNWWPQCENLYDKLLDIADVYGETVNPKKRVKVTKTNFKAMFKNRSLWSTRVVHPLMKTPYVIRVLEDHFNEVKTSQDPVRGRHIVYSFPARPNELYDFTAQDLIELFLKEPVPLLVICMYRSSSLSHDKGLRILLNKAALPYVRRIKDADIQLNIKRDHVRERDPRKLFKDADGFEKRVITQNLVEDGRVMLSDEIPEILFPKTVSYTIREALDLIDKSAALCDRNPDDLNVVTLGEVLMSEGTVLKSNSHTHPPTDFIPGTWNYDNKSVTEREQHWKRLCGRRNDGIIPRMHMTVEMFKWWITGLDATTQLSRNVMDGMKTGKRPQESLQEPTRRLKKAPKYLVNKKLQPHDFHARIVVPNTTDEPTDFAIHPVVNPTPPLANTLGLPITEEMIIQSLMDDLAEFHDKTRSLFRRIALREDPTSGTGEDGDWWYFSDIFGDLGLSGDDESDFNDLRDCIISLAENDSVSPWLDLYEATDVTEATDALVLVGYDPQALVGGRLENEAAEDVGSRRRSVKSMVDQESIENRDPNNYAIRFRDESVRQCIVQILQTMSGN